MPDRRWCRGFALLPLVLALGGCGGTTQTVDQAIKCSDFTRLPSGAWSTTADVSLDYLSDGIRHQSNFGKGVVLKADGAESKIVAAVEKKCAPGK